MAERRLKKGLPESFNIPMPQSFTSVIESRPEEDKKTAEFPLVHCVLLFHSLKLIFILSLSFLISGHCPQ